eukprot:g2363.t1
MAKGCSARATNIVMATIRGTIPSLAVAFWFFGCGGIAQYDSCNGSVANIGDGRCDPALNTPYCGWDGGDCCHCTCSDSPVYACADSVFDCLYPDCDDPTPSISEDSPCVEDWIGDGYCDHVNNVAPCHYDGGDCCPCSCSDTPEYTCGLDDVFDCRGPACFDPTLVAEFPDCPGDWLLIGDGSCNAENNLAVCGWDGGDCCPCDCLGATCATTHFDCLDPAAGDEIYDCKATPPPALPCSADVQRTWLVETSAQARALVAATNCSSGSFEVEWRGHIAVDEPFHVVDGTVFTLRGAAPGAVIDGNGSTRLFTVVNATLHVSGINITNGASVVGGAITASGATLMLNRTSLTGNRAALDGGSVYISDGSSLSCADVSFITNRADVNGGAAYVTGGSFLSCGGSWLNNTAGGYGGALGISDGSTASWGEDTTFSRNRAGLGGGGLAVVDRSTASWSGPNSYINNSAESGGGALEVVDSNVSWTGEALSLFNENKALFGGALSLVDAQLSSSENTTTLFTGNLATMMGGANSMARSRVVFGGNVWFDSCRATGEPDVFESGFGGAVVAVSSNVAWHRDIKFTENSADKVGGAIYVDDSSISSNGSTHFAGNNARLSGGGIFLWNGSHVEWTGDTTFTWNEAGADGGAVGSPVFDSEYNRQRSTLVMNGATAFVNNTSGGNGGALALSEGLSMSISALNVSFVENAAEVAGGAVYVSATGSGPVFTGVDFMYNFAQWTGDTTFTWNEAGADGGAVASPVFDSEFNRQRSTLVMNGTTAFVNNTSGGNGGALALSEGLSMFISALNVGFVENAAEVAGGAVYVSATGSGPVFTGVDFMYNFAQVGGAVSTLGSGNLKGFADVESPNPTTYERCRFIGNRAAATGGAIESASGQDSIFNSVFEGNRAAVGGALRLAGAASAENCTFADNTSDDGGGAAVSTVGSNSRMTNISFRGNGFYCQPDMFLDFESGDPYEAVCSSCQMLCDGCFFEEPDLVPVCEGVMEHSKSSGGTVTLETLSIDPGYWRATASSKDILACHHADACLGGVSGTDDFCLEGYEGPYCSVCSDGYTAQLGYTCNKCSDSTGGTLVVAVVVVVAVAVVMAVITYVVSGEVGCMAHGGSLGRLFRKIPLQSVKIVVVVWQILTQRFLDALDVFNFDLTWILSAGCVVDVNFHDRLLVSTITPLIAMLFMAGTYAAATTFNRGAPDALQIIWNKHVSLVLLLTFLVYSSVSATLFKTFACDHLADGNIYLLADYRIKCDSPKHEAFEVYAGVMMVLYTAGIPALYGYLLFRDRDVLAKNEAEREDIPRVTTISDLWKPYKPSAFYYELIECGRRILLTGVVVFIEPDTSAQIAVTLMMAFVFVVISEALAPYASRWDAWLSRMGHAVVFVSMYVALLLKLDVSDERASSQKVFEEILVSAHTCMVLVVVVETVVLTCSFTKQRGHGQVPPWIRRDGETFPGNSLKEENPFASHMYKANVQALV